ncbi:MAG TPA: mechanosensitive ion channel domain-containing protein [Geopsychrobacteraceae bacterium]|nr:mechanosensitive ion channel domain-containing protein [Geopsychrobacteraceae bacterium]
MVLKSLSSLLFCVALVCTFQVSALHAAVSESVSADTAAEVPALPALSELSQRSTVLADYLSKAEEQLQQLSDLSRPKGIFSEITERFNKVLKEIQPLGVPEAWYLDRLTYYLNRFSQIRQDLDGLQKRLSLRQQDAEEIRGKLTESREFWSAWADQLKTQDVNVPVQTITQVMKGLDQAEGSLKKTSDNLLQLQEEVGAFHLELNRSSERLLQSLAKQKKAVFHKNTYSFFSQEYYQQLTSDHLPRIKEGVATAIKYDPVYLRENGLFLGLLGGMLLLIAGALRHYRDLLKEADEWNFILDHPIAAASFVSAIIFWVLFPVPPPLTHFIFYSVTAASATTLASPLLENRRQIFVLILAAVVVLLTSAFQSMSLPLPLFRLFLACLAVVFVPLLLWQILLSKKLRKAGEGRLFRAFLRLSVVVLTISFIAQVAGHMNFSTWLVQAAFETGLVLLLANMTVKFLGGCVALASDLFTRSRRSFLKEFASGLSLRLKKLSKFVIYAFAGFYLLPAWRIFASLGEGWTYFTELTIGIGSLTISMQMLISAVVALYLSLQFSWFLQGLSEIQIMGQRSADIGVRDAVKKLIHYGVVLIGLLLALGFLGFGLQNLVVLLGAFGIGIGFGLQDIVNNFLSGLILLFERPIKVGDGVLIDGDYGVVTRIGLRSTVVKNLDHAELIVPNAQMISQKVTNWTLSDRRVRLVVPVGVAYGSDLEKVQTILKEVGEQHPEVLSDPGPLPLFVQFGSSSLDFELRVWIANVDHRPRINNEVLLSIDRRFREAGIEISFPQQDLHLRTVSAGIFPTLREKPE